MTGIPCTALCLLVAVLVPACGRADMSGPPTVRLGRDECAGCGMIVNEDRCSCAVLVEQDGQRVYLVFDDLGCLLDHRSDHPATDVIDAYVHDHGTGAWISASTAHFLFGASDGFHTPMGSGMVAFETQDRAREERSKSGGEIGGYDELVEARRGWREARRTGASGSP